MMALHDRRKVRRYRPIRMDEVLLALPDGDRLACRILDISPQGIKAELATPDSRLVRGQRLAIAECPPELADLLGACRIELRWIEGPCFGAVFESPLTVSVEGLGGDARFSSF